MVLPVAVLSEQGRGVRPPPHGAVASPRRGVTLALLMSGRRYTTTPKKTRRRRVDGVVSLVSSGQASERAIVHLRHHVEVPHFTLSRSGLDFMRNRHYHERRPTLKDTGSASLRCL